MRAVSHHQLSSSLMRRSFKDDAVCSISELHIMRRLTSQGKTAHSGERHRLLTCAVSGRAVAGSGVWQRKDWGV